MSDIAPSPAMTCQQCRRPIRRDRKDRRWCSRTCADRWRWLHSPRRLRGLRDRYCAVCGLRFKVRRHEGRRRYCGIDCRRRARNAAQRAARAAARAAA